MKYEIVIGLEVHAQLNTNTKMYCSCSTAFGDEANIHICPVCTAQPGALPVVNRQAIEKAIKAGLALSCEIHHTSVFSRKNYFYPDLTKGYQISQFDLPLCTNGKLEIALENEEIKSIHLQRIHLEEDAGKLLHDEGHADKSHVDYNRCGTPLIEIVSGPDMRSAEEASLYLKKLHAVLVYLDVCDGNLQEGNFRCDANVSIRPVGEKKFGMRTEMKNLNSFRAVERAIRYEALRHQKIIEEGGSIVQETRLWDDAKGSTHSMRSKEEAHDYRYFPDPDLLPLEVNVAWIEKVKAELPELATEKAKRFVSEYDIPEYDAQVLTADKHLAHYFEKVVSIYNAPKKISNWIMTELLRELNLEGIFISNCNIKPESLAALVKAVEEKEISGKIGKEVFLLMYKTGSSPKQIIAEQGFAMVSDTGELEKCIDEVLSENPKQLADYKSGKDKLFGFFVGQVMKKTKGQASPDLVNELLKKKL